jgi:D-tyrosyl-tRNA(Tyr) deacylase|tara:strand:- start:1347 stop:1799 length:453 start_codon:yes stop_codon:yes gene_type:complete
MRLVLQRTSEASVSIENKKISEIKKGLIIFLGVEEKDDFSDINWLVNKVLSLRIFSDENNKMNLSVEQVSGEIMVVSQFTLHAKVKKGNRPSFIKSARSDKANDLYEKFILELSKVSKCKIKKGKFGADMKVAIVNDGPVTILIDSKNKE